VKAEEFVSFLRLLTTALLKKNAVKLSNLQYKMYFCDCVADVEKTASAKLSY
jgi:hypothetical protein